MTNKAPAARPAERLRPADACFEIVCGTLRGGGLARNASLSKAPCDPGLMGGGWENPAGTKRKFPVRHSIVDTVPFTRIERLREKVRWARRSGFPSLKGVMVSTSTV